MLFLLILAWPAAASAQTNLGTFSIGYVDIPLNGPATWAFDSGVLPPGVSFRPDPPPWAPAATAGLAGIATQPGTYFFNLLRNGVSQSYTIRIISLVRKEWNVPDAFVGMPYSYQLAALNGAAVWSVIPGTLPPGMSLTSSGLFSGTPTLSGFYNVTFRLSDGVDTTVLYSFHIRVFDVQIVTDGMLPNATMNKPYSATLTASGGSGSFRFTTTNNLPTGLVLSESGEFSGTPTNIGAGKWSFDVTATDTDGVSYTKRMSIDILGTPPALPAIMPFGNVLNDCSFGVPCHQGAFVGAGGRAPFTWTVTGLPPGMGFRYGSGKTLWWITPGDVEIWGTATALGTFPVQFTVTDADGLTASNTFDLNVRPLWLWNPLVEGLIGVPYNHRFRVLGGRLPYTSSLVGGRLPVDLALSPAALTVAGTPMENGGFNPDFEFTDADGAALRLGMFFFIGSTTSTINLNTFDDLGTITEGFFYSNQFLACCAPSYSWTIADGSLPPGLTLSSSGLLSGTPPPGTAGAYTFMARVEDAANSANYAIRQFKLVVTPLSLTTFSLPFGNVATLYSASLTATGGAGITWTLEPFEYLPPGLTLHANGLIDGTPTARGQFTFQVRATDSAGHILLRRFGISIYGVGEKPPLNLPIGPNLGPLLGPFAFRLDAVGGTPPYHYSLTPGAPEIPGMRVQDGQPLPTSFPPSTTGGFIGVITTPGVYPTSIRVTDAVGDFFDRAFTVTVASVTVLSFPNLPKGTVGVPYSFTLTPFGGTAYSWSANALPPGLSIDSSGQIFGTPTSAGTFFPRVTITDLATQDTLSVGLTLTVDRFAITTGGVLPQGLVGTLYTQTLNAPGCGATCTWSSFSSSIGGGISLSPDGELSGTPTFATSTFFTVQVSGSNGTVQKVFSLQIVGATPQPLVITTAALNDTPVGSTIAVPLFALGGTPPYTWSQSGTLPPGVSLERPGEALGATVAPGFTYLLGRGMQTGVYNVTVTVADAAGATASRSFSWNISALSFQYFNLPIAGNALVYNTPYTQSLLVMGGTNNYTWTSGVMPPGLVLEPATGVVTGTPQNTGFISVPIQVTDTGSNRTTANVNFNIAAPAGSPLNFNLGPILGPVQQGNSASFNATPIGGVPPYTVTALTALPPGFTLQPLPGPPSGSAAVLGVALTPGIFAFTLEAQDSVGNLGVRTFTLTVAPFTLFSPSSALPDGSVGTPYAHSLLVFNSTIVTWSVPPDSALPPGMTLSPAGAIGGTPTVAGAFSFVLLATDTVSSTSVRLGFALRISNISITSASILPEAIIGQPYVHTFTATGGSSTNVWTVSGLPAGLSMSSSGSISGTINSGGSSAFTLLVTVTDGVVAILRRFTLFVRPAVRTVLDVPMATTRLADAVVGQATSYTLTASGGEPPYTFTLATGSSLPPGMRLISGAALPAGAFAPGTTILAGAPSTPGTYTFDLIASDASHSEALRTYSLNVSSFGVFGAPGTGTTGSSYLASFVGAGGTPPYTFSMTPANRFQDMLPPGLTMSSAGIISGIPTSTGNYAFVLRVEDAAGRRFRRTFSFVVNNPSGLRVTNLNPADARVGRPVSVQLFTSGTSTYTWTQLDGTLPPGIALASGGPGITVLAGRATTPGTYQLRLRATDDLNATNIAEHAFTWTVTSMQVVAPPSFDAFRLPSGHVGELYSFAIKIAGGTPPYTFSESPFNPLPPGLTLSTSGVLSGTLTAIGNFAVVPVVADAAARSTNSSISLNLVVTPAGTPAPFFADPEVQGRASVGTVFSFPLERRVHGGAPPYVWSLASGVLPPGMALLPGGNGVPTFSSGAPTTPGSFALAFLAEDASGQQATAALTLNVSTVALTPNALPPATVGVPYSAPLRGSGGLAPYTIQLEPDQDLPPGLTINTAGSLAGTPRFAGFFRIAVGAQDSAGVIFRRGYDLTIDNAAGEAPAVTLAPKPIQIYYERGATPLGPVPISINATTGTHAFTLKLLGAPWASLSTNTGTAPSSINLNPDVASLGLGTYIGLLAVSAPDSTNQVDTAPLILTIADPPPCSYSVQPPSGTATARGGPAGFTIETGSTCSWNAVVSDPTWITVTNGTGGTGTKTLTYSIAANRGAARTGTIDVNGAVYTVTQFGVGCSIAISPTNLSVGAAGGSAIIAIAASASSCTWTAAGLAATPSGGAGNGTVAVTIPANPDVLPRAFTATFTSGTVIHTLNVTQTGAACTVGLSSPSASHSSAKGSGSVDVATPAGCSYDTVPGPSWIHLTSGASGTGSGTLGYSVDANSTTLPRAGTLSIGGQPFQITQDALACSATIDTSGLGSPFDAGGGVGTIAIAMNGSNCSWTASSAAAFAAVTPSSGTGNGTVIVGIASNTSSTTPRSGAVTIAGQTIGVSQSGTVCEYALQSSTGSVPASGGAGSVGVVATAACTWTSASNDTSWLTIASSGSAGSADVNFVAQPNVTSSPRTGTLTIASLIYTVNQAPAPCSYSLSSTNVTVSADGASGSFSFSAGAVGCSPDVRSFASWTHVTPSFSGTSGTVTFSVDPNPSALNRVGTIQVGTQTFTVTQLGSPCGFSLSAYGAWFTRDGGIGSFLGSPSGLGCTPIVGVDLPSIITLGPLGGPVSNIFTQPYDVAPFAGSLTPVVRRARITFGGQIFTVKQTSW